VTGFRRHLVKTFEGNGPWGGDLDTGGSAGGAVLDDKEALMLSPELLVARIRGEYREMPGLRLTFAQACRLWQVDASTCEAVLQTLLAEGFLVRTADGAFMALPTPHMAHATPLKAALAQSGPTDSRLPRRA